LIGEFGVRVRALRRDSGLTQRALARDAGVDFTYLSKIENGRLEHLPSVKTIRQCWLLLYTSTT
jgi:HTH-type transcriptional regulator, competence development regulator